MAATVNIGVFGVFNSPMAQMAVLPLTTSCTKEVDREEEETQDWFTVSKAQYGSRAATQSL